MNVKPIETPSIDEERFVNEFELVPQNETIKLTSIKQQIRVECTKNPGLYSLVFYDPKLYKTGFPWLYTHGNTLKGASRGLLWCLNRAIQFVSTPQT
jgi:hypothetical protein